MLSPVSDNGGSPDSTTHWFEMNIEETMAVLTKCSFDEQHRLPIFNLGGIQVKLVSVDLNDSPYFI